MFPLNVSTIGLPKMMKSHKGYIYLTCLPFDIDCNSFPDSSFCHISGSQTTHFRSKSSQSRPRFSRLPFWPAGFILPRTHWNLNDIFFPIWILWERCDLWHRQSHLQVHQCDVIGFSSQVHSALGQSNVTPEYMTLTAATLAPHPLVQQHWGW